MILVVFVIIKFNSFSNIKNFFNRLNPLNLIDFGDIDVEIEKAPTSEKLLIRTIEKYSDFKKVMLIALYHLINTQNSDKEYLTILTKDLRLICDLVEGDGESVEIPDFVKKEPLENIFLTCHNHFQNAIIPSTKDFKNIIKPKIRFTIIISDEHIGIIINELGEKLNYFSKSEKKNLKTRGKHIMII